MERRHENLQGVPPQQALHTPRGVREGDLQEGNPVRIKPKEAEEISVCQDLSVDHNRYWIGADAAKIQISISRYLTFDFGFFWH